MTKLTKQDVNITEKVIVPQDKENIEQELRAMTKEALIIRLNFEETNPKIIKLIKKIIKEKE